MDAVQKHQLEYDNYLRIIDVYVRQNRCKEAQECLNKIQELSKELQGQVTLFQCLDRHGDVQCILGQYDKALEYYKESKSLKLDQMDNTSYHIANSYLKIGDVYSYQYRYDDALSMYQEAASIYSIFNEESKKQRIALAVVYCNIGHVYCLQASFGKAVEYYQKSLRIRNRSDENHPDVTDLHNAMANIELLKHCDSSYKKAFEYYNELLVKKQGSSEGQNDDEIAQLYFNIAVVYYNQGRYHDAVEKLEESRHIRKSLHTEYNIDVASLYYYIGIIKQYYQQSETTEAKDMYRETKKNEATIMYQNALKIRLILAETIHTGIAWRCYNMGLIHHFPKIVDQEAAKYVKNKYFALEFNNKKYDLFRIYYSLGCVYCNQNENNKVLLSQGCKMLEKSLEQLRGQEMSYKQQVARLYDMLGYVYCYIPDYDKAITMYQELLQLYGENNYKAKAKVYHTMERIYNAKRDFDKAKTMHQLSQSMTYQGNDYYTIPCLIAQ